MNQFQKGLNIRSAEDLYPLLPDNELKVIKFLRNLILDNCPELQEHIAYNVPFYKGKKNVCFLWPAAVPWGNVAEGVALGFTRGDELMDDEQILEAGTRKHVRTVVFTQTIDIKPEQVLTYLFEAVELDKTY